MYELDDTIIAVSSPTSDQRVIIRITGPVAIEVLQRIFIPHIDDSRAGIIAGEVVIDDELRIDAKLYLFLAPHSYTGDCLAELHIHTNSSVTERLISDLLFSGFLRMAGPGEFTARAYLNGKIDLAQAEAVGEIVAGSNRFQLAAAEKLLAGQLAKTTMQIGSSVMDCLSRIEAGLDFSGEDIEFITRPEAVEELTAIKMQLEQLLSGSICYESVLDLPAVGLAGSPNAGKSSLLNKLLNQRRSIVSHKRKTTRDVLTGLLTLSHCRCVLFDCAGLTLEPNNILEEMAQQAAVEALRNASVVVFCVDISMTDHSEDIAIRKLIEPKALVPVATKSDLLSEQVLSKRLAELKELFGADFLAVSVESDSGLKRLRDMVNRKIIELATGSAESETRYEIRDTRYEIALTARHKQAVNEAVESIEQAIGELKLGNDEVVAMLLRAVHGAICLIVSAPADEQILEQIFSRFCIGK